jgi:predicted acylesterase/phospholipase RssA
MTDSALLEAPATFLADPDAPLGPLSLSLSGGGYRAAGFHLGVMELLDDVGLLSNVTSLSTVSGGTIFGAAWVVKTLDGMGFEAFRGWFREWMLKTNVVREALAGLAAGEQGQSRASLIRSAARVYAAEGFLGDRRFGEVMEGSGIPAEVIFNATEFRSGVAFRFRRSPNPDARVGNGNFIVPREVAEQVRLADVVAASSCFPGGFEPICFPDEFEWGPGFGLERAREALGEKFVPALPLMDGGVYDNQGVGSSILANEHGEAATLLISDTNTRQEALYTTPESPGRGWLTLNGAAWVGRILFVLAVASIVALALHAWHEQKQGGWQWNDILVYVVPGIFCLAGAAALATVRRAALDVGVRLRERVQIARAWNDVRRLTIPEVVSLVELRATSLLSLTSNVFMKRVRELVLGSVDANERYRHRRAPVLLYQLDLPDAKLYHEVPWLRPSAKLVAQVRSVDTMSTTLWFDSQDQLDTLEQVGAATAAFALLKLIVEREGPEGGAPGTSVHILFHRLRARWDAYNT